MATILYVDGDPERGERMRMALEQAGHQMHQERSAERALLFIQRGSQIDALVLNLFLHGMDGAELCRWVQKDSRLQRLPKVAFTAPGSPLKFPCADALPPWIPIDHFIQELDDPLPVVQALEKLLTR